MKETNAAYDALAEWFEYLNDDCGYEEWSQYLLSLLQNYGACRDVVDLGCGSGYFTRALARAGYCVTGVDISPAMLSAAAERSLKEGLNIPFLQGDASSLVLPHKVDCVVAVNDCFNYVPKEKLLTALRRVNRALKKDGLFFFDVSAPGKLRNLPPVSIDDREDVTYISFNRVAGEAVTMEVSLFVRENAPETAARRGGRPQNAVGTDGCDAADRYVRRDETHTQYIYDAEEILFSLSLAGFEPLFYSGHLGEEAEGSDRLEFLVRKV